MPNPRVGPPERLARLRRLADADLGSRGLLAQNQTTTLVFYTLESIRFDVTTKRIYSKAAMELEWNADKAALNLKKHGVSFEDAELVFYDTRRIETHDGREDYGEDRWATIGLAYSAVLYMVYIVRHEETICLISARKANANERNQYREANS